MNIESYRVTAAIDSHSGPRGVVLRLVRLLGFYACVSLGGAVGLLVVKALILSVDITFIANMGVWLLVGLAASTAVTKWLELLISSQKEKFTVLRWRVLMACLLFLAAVSVNPVRGLPSLESGLKGILGGSLAVLVGLGGLLQAGKSVPETVLKVLEQLKLISRSGHSDSRRVRRIAG